MAEPDPKMSSFQNDVSFRVHNFWLHTKWESGYGARSRLGLSDPASCHCQPKQQRKNLVMCLEEILLDGSTVT